MSVRQRTLKNGSTVFDARVRDVRGKELSHTFPTKSAARRFEREWLVARDRGLVIRPAVGRTPFAEIAREWLDHNGAKKANTLHTDGRIVDKQLAALHDRRIGVITRAEVQRLVNDWSLRYQPRSVHRYFSVGRAVFNFAVDNDLIGRSPCLRVKLPRVERVHRPGTLTPDRISQMCEAVGPRYRALLLLMAETGVRPQEAFALRVGRTHLMGGLPCVVIADTFVEVGGRLTEGPPKSESGNRTLGISRMLADELAAHLSRQGIDATSPDAIVFTTESGSPVRYSNFRSRVWLPARSAAGVEWATMYDLRRANVTAMFDSGVDVSTAQKRMGHADPRLTLGTYAQRSSSSDQAAAVRLGCWLADGFDQVEHP